MKNKDIHLEILKLTVIALGELTEKFDVMPADSKILGFTNKWYKAGIENAIELELGKTKIKVFSPAFLIASKIEAFKGRGKDSFSTSSDIEDIVTIFDGRSNIAKDLMAISNLNY